MSTKNTSMRRLGGIGRIAWMILFWCLFAVTATAADLETPESWDLETDVWLDEEMVLQDQSDGTWDAAVSAGFPRGTYQIVASHSFKCLDLDVAYGGNGNSTKVQQWGCNGWRNQKWLVLPYDGHLLIKSVHNGKELDLDIASGGYTNGDKLQIWAWNGWANQQWSILATGGDRYKVVSRHSNKVMDVSGVSYSDGAQIHQWDFVGGANQQWYFQRTSALARSVGEANNFHLTQYYDPTYNADGPSSSWNCGPTSLAIAMRVLGRMPWGQSQNQMIRHMRYYISKNAYPAWVYYISDRDGVTRGQSQVGEPVFTVGSTNDELKRVIGELGASTRNIYYRGELDWAMDNGYAVILNGYIDQDWRNQFAGWPGRYGSGEIGHYCTVTGRVTENGVTKYIVQDPMFTGGAVTMTWEQLIHFPQTYLGMSGFTVEF